MDAAAARRWNPRMARALLVALAGIGFAGCETAGSMGSLNEFTIAHDEGKVIGCLCGTGGVADEADYLLAKFSKETGAQVFQHSDPSNLVDACIGAIRNAGQQRTGN